MKSAWFGGSTAPANNATTYNFLTACLSVGFQTVETSTSGAGGRTCPLTDACNIKRLRVKVTTAPGVGKSWTFTVRDDGAGTSAQVVISGTNTEATWTDTASIAAGSLVSLESVPSGTPTAAGATYWTVEYETSGNFYMILGGSSVGISGNTVHYQTVTGCGSYSPSGTIANLEMVAPTGFAVTKIGALCFSTAPGSDSDTFAAFKNGTTASGAVVITGAGVRSVIGSITSFAVAAGDTFVMRVTPSNPGPWSNFATCMTIVPDTAGETIVGFGSTQAPSTSANEYEGINGTGVVNWQGTEASAQLMVPACTAKKLYEQIATASGAAKSYAFTLRKNAADTSITTTLTNVTTGNDTTHSETLADGDLLSIKCVPTGTPTTTNGVHSGLVLAIPQSSTGNFFLLL